MSSWKERVCGAYAIIAPNGDTYVGCSTHCYMRWSTHRSLLTYGKSEYCEYFADALRAGTLSFVLLETCGPDERFAVERKWMLAFPGIVNKTVGTKSLKTRERLRAALIGRPLSLETREKMSRAKLGTTVSSEVRAKISLAHRGKKFSLKTRRKLIDSAKKRWASTTQEQRSAIAKARAMKRFPERCLCGAMTPAQAKRTYHRCPQTTETATPSVVLCV